MRSGAFDPALLVIFVRDQRVIQRLRNVQFHQIGRCPWRRNADAGHQFIIFENMQFEIGQRMQIKLFIAEFKPQQTHTSCRVGNLGNEAKPAPVIQSADGTQRHIERIARALVIPLLILAAFHRHIEIAGGKVELLRRYDRHINRPHAR